MIVSIIMMSLSYYFSVVMTKEDFGLFSYLQSVYMVLLNFLPFGAGMAVVTHRYSIDALSYRRLISSFLFPVIPLSFIASLGVAAILSVVGKTQELILLMLVALLALNNTFIVLALNHMRVEQKIIVLAFFHVASTAALVCSFVISYSVYRDISYSYISACGASLIFCLASLGYLSKNIGFDFVGFKLLYILKARISYGSLVVMSSVLMSFMALSDKLILANLMSAPKFGEYAVVSLIASTTLFLVNSFASTWASYLNGKLHKLNIEQRKHLLAVCEKKIPWALILIFPIIVFQIGAYQYFYKTDEFVLSLIFLSFSFYVYGISKIYMGFLNAYHKNGLVVLSTLLGLLVTFIILMVYDGANYALIMPLSLIVGYCFQLAACRVFTNKILSLNVGENAL